MSVKVAVRVRPFNSREKTLNCQCVVEMKNPTTILKAQNGEQQRMFTFDYSFWSFDQYEEHPQTGYLLPNASKKYADQDLVYKQIGTKILDNAWEGYHCCLFAYGQTGAGKSYSMIGYGNNKGIVPITCNQIFERIARKQQHEDFEVSVSMMEIYNQAVQDLTIPVSKRAAQGLQIRQNKLFGVYVEGIKKHLVRSFQDIETVMQEGTKNRTVAATQMNATSSRAHTIISVEFKQIKRVGQTKSERISMINLVDLAGSERQDKTGATGQRLKEAVGINQSLTNLGQVISVLAENSQGANKFVPYRNSALTRILQNALGGNSQTVMICAISPASDNYEETLSTLRYADRAKKIKNKPVVNQNETDKLIRQLKLQNDRLRKMLENRQKDPIEAQKKKTIRMKIRQQRSNKENTQFGMQCEFDDEEQQQDEDIKANLNFLSFFLADKLKTKQEKEEQAKRDMEDIKKNHEKEEGQRILNKSALKKLKQDSNELPPYLENISKDFMLNRKLKILLQKRIITVGKKGMEPPNDIVFGGRDMANHHAIIQVTKDRRVLLCPRTQRCHLYVNGKKVTERVQLMNLDRIVFGWNSVYLFKDKNHKRSDQTIKSKDINWEFCKEQMRNQVDIDQSDTESKENSCEIY